MIELKKDIRYVQFQLSKKKKKITTYKTASFNDLLDLLDSKNYEIDQLETEISDLKSDLEENYRPISREEELL